MFAVKTEVGGANVLVKDATTNQTATLTVEKTVYKKEADVTFFLHSMKNVMSGSRK